MFFSFLVGLGFDCFQTVKLPSWRWAVPILLSLVGFTNHYARDVPGALEKQVGQVFQSRTLPQEGSSLPDQQSADCVFVGMCVFVGQIMNGLSLSEPQFNALNSVFFAPNCVLPLAAGALADRYGSRSTFMFFSGVLARYLSLPPSLSLSLAVV